MNILAKPKPTPLESFPIGPHSQQTEVSFLLTCLQPTQPELCCPPNLDWAVLLALAADHGVSGLVTQRLLTQCPTDLPLWVQAKLANQRHQDACRGLALVALLLKLWHRFTDAGIQVTTFKGPAFASEVYGNLLVRASVDLDLFVPLDQVIPAHQILRDEGFLPLFNLTADQLADYVKVFHALTFANAHTGQKVDLHWSLLLPQYSFCPPPAWLWAHLTPISLSGQTITTLTPECLLLFMCAHSAKENWDRLRFFVDLAALLARYPQLDWDWIWAHAGQLGSKRMLKLGLYLTQLLLAVELPATALTQIATDPALPKLARWIIAELIPAPTHQPPFWSWVNQIKCSFLFYYSVFFYHSLDRWPDRWQYVKSFFNPTPKEYESLQLPAPLMFLYFPYRLIRLAHKHTLARWV